MKLIKIYNLIKETHDDLECLVQPVVRLDIREQLSKLRDAMELLEERWGK